MEGSCQTALQLLLIVIHIARFPCSSVEHLFMQRDAAKIVCADSLHATVKRQEYSKGRVREQKDLRLMPCL